MEDPRGGGGARRGERRRSRRCGARGKASTEINPPGDVWPGGSLQLVSNPQGCRAIEPARTRLVSTPTRKTAFESTAYAVHFNVVADGTVVVSVKVFGPEHA